METLTPGVRAPKQSRSQESFDRILAAAEEILETKPLNEVRLAEIADRAGLTTGAIYARFDGKAALFECLERQVRSDLNEAIQGALSSIEPETRLRERVALLLLSVGRFYRERRGGVRAIVMTAATDPETQRRRAEANELLLDRVLSELQSAPDEMSHPEPAAAVRLAMLATLSALREIYLFPGLLPTASPPPVEKTCDELSHFFVHYLTASRNSTD